MHPPSSLTVALRQPLLSIRTIVTSPCASNRQLPLQPRSENQPQRRAKPPYQVNKITADLDNPLQQGVRYVTAEDEDAMKDVWVTQPEKQDQVEHRKRVSLVARQLKAYKSKAGAVKANPFNPWRISEMDLYSYVLIEATRPTRLRKWNDIDDNIAPEVALGRVLHNNGIVLRSAHGPSDALKLMAAHWNYLPRNQDPNTLVHLVQRFAESDFVQWRRLISTFLAAPASQKEFHAVEDQLVGAYAGMSGPAKMDSEALAVVNNAVMNLDARSAVIGKPFCFLGLMLACRMVSIPAIARYLSIGIDQGYFTCPSDSQHSEAPESTPNNIHEGLKTAEAALNHSLSILFLLLDTPKAFPVLPQTSETLPRELLTLLTGRLLHTTERQPCFRDAIGDSVLYFEAYAQYVRILGMLGATRLLWYEYHTKTGCLTPQYPEGGKNGGLNRVGQRQELFCNALYLSATSLRGSVSRPRPRSASQEPDYWRDCAAESESLKDPRRVFGCGGKREEIKLEKGVMAQVRRQKVDHGLVSELIDALELPLEASMEVLHGKIPLIAAQK